MELYKKRKDLNNYIIYSHNGGKFDILLLLREYLLQDDSLWSISMEYGKDGLFKWELLKWLKLRTVSIRMTFYYWAFKKERFSCGNSKRVRL